MKKQEVIDIAKNFLKGDNSNAEIIDSVILLAVKEVCMRCEPLALLDYYDETKTDVFRIVLAEEADMYLKMPTIVDDEITLDEDLFMAVVFFICSYYSNKNKDYYEKKADSVIAMFKTNNINVV